MQQVDKGYSFMATQRMSPAYYKRNHALLLSWIRQQGPATWFLTLTMSEGSWLDLLKILFVLKNGPENMPDDDYFRNLSWKEKCELIKSNPFAISRHFDKKLRYLHRDVIKGPAKPLGEVVDHVGCVEAQYRGSLHIHELLFCKAAPVIDVDDDRKVCDFVDEFVSCSKRLPDIPGIELTEEDRLLPEKLQLHSHRSTCRRGKNKSCRFNMPFPPLKRTTVLRPLVGVDDLEKKRLRKVRSRIIDCVNSVLKDGSDPSFEEFLGGVVVFQKKLMTMLCVVMLRVQRCIWRVVQVREM